MEWATLTIAIIALVQPWAVAVWRRFFRQGDLDIHETGLIEVGFSGFGPTVGLHGTLRALHRDLFISDMALTVVRLRDGARHEFRWTVFRDGSMGQEVFSLPASFLVSTAQPHRYNTLFSDNETRSEIQDELSPVVEAWQSSFLEHSPFDEGDGLYDLYEEFSEERVHVEAYSEISRRCYWDQGQYSLELLVTTSRPQRSFTRRWTFELNNQQSELLRRNTVSILRNTVGLTDLPFNFAYPTYQD